MNNRKYFGTDGIRGKVGETPITPDFILKLGWAAGKVLAQNRSRKVIIGKDTRISSHMLELLLKAGLTAAGVSTLFTDYIPTPAIAYFTRIFKAEAGIVISASHNLYYDNGVKFFSHDGTKLSDEIEKTIETEMKKQITCVDSMNLGHINYIHDAAGRYIEFCKSTFSNKQTLLGLKLVIDCSNGSTYNIAPNVFRELGAEVIPIRCEPNGININNGYYSKDINLLKQKILDEKADAGFIFDGDGDRIIMIDHLSKKINGDQILYIIAKELLRQNKLKGGVIGTLMSNTGLEKALNKLKIPFERTKVGDRYILSKLQEKKWSIGGENSGHIILLNKTTTGDGIIAALQVLNAMVNNKMSLHDLCNDIKLYHQKLINVKNNNDLLQNNSIIKIINQIKKELSKKIRILLRKSGTEQLIRIMIEGENKEEVSTIAHKISNKIKTIK